MFLCDIDHLWNPDPKIVATPLLWSPRRERGVEIRIRSESDLQDWDARIGSLMQRHELDYILGGIRQSLKEMHPFTAAGAASFAIRFALPPILRPSQLVHMPWSELQPIANLVTQYLIADPVSFEPPIEDDYHNSTLVPVLIRLVGNQFLSTSISLANTRDQ